MTALMVATETGGLRFSLGKIAGIGLQVLGAAQMFVPFLNGWFGWHIPVPVPGIEGLAENAYAAVKLFLEGLGIFGVRRAIG